MADIRVTFSNLLHFSQQVFMKLGMNEKDAFIAADVLVRADYRGIPSHGVQRLRRYYNGIQDGIIIPDARPEVSKEGPVYVWMDGKHAMGQVAAFETMEKVIDKALKNGMAIGSTYNSNHYGYAGHYALMAQEKGLIGFSLTNSAPLVVPTYGKQSVLGTNPISMAVPTRRNRPFVMDFATSIVARGKIEMYKKWGEQLPENWAVNEHGEVCIDPARVLKNLAERLGGGILPLGGAGEKFGGHKGYGLTMMVDILTGVLSGAHFSIKVASKAHAKPGEKPYHNVGHFFMAFDPDIFVGKEEFMDRMDELIDIVKHSEKAKGQNRIYIHGEKEFEKMDEFDRDGIPIIEKVYLDMKDIGDTLGVEFPEFTEEK
ncbi:MAG: Ldh family oxidoreductase [Calditrichia bacterium]